MKETDETIAVAFIRLFFRSPVEKEIAHRWLCCGGSISIAPAS